MESFGFILCYPNLNRNRAIPRQIGEFLRLLSLRAASLVQSYRWPEANARVQSAECHRKTNGCPVVTIDYLYVIGEKRYRGSYSKPFILLTSAQVYVHVLWYRGSLEERARVNPKNPSASVYHRY
jgi:hypothetical protein